MPEPLDLGALVPDVSARENGASVRLAEEVALVTQRSRRRRIPAGSYAAYISSSSWRLSPARFSELLASGGRCRICNGEPPEAALTVHHRTYERLGFEHADDLTTLCEDCHDVVTEMLRRRAHKGKTLPDANDLAKTSPQRILVDNLAMDE